MRSQFLIPQWEAVVAEEQRHRKAKRFPRRRF